VSEYVAPTVSCDEVKEFVRRSGKTKVELDKLFGGSGASLGKNITRWSLYGAPASISILMAYMAQFGTELAEELIKSESITLDFEEKPAS
jgi:hypothetical protein